MNATEKIIVARKVANGEFNDPRFTLKQQIDEFLDEERCARAIPQDPLKLKKSWARAMHDRLTVKAYRDKFVRRKKNVA